MRYLLCAVTLPRRLGGGMKFILWTAVWFGLDILGKWVLIHYNATKEFSSTTEALASTIYFFLWIFLYIKFIK
jgi:hypothetical protein